MRLPFVMAICFPSLATQNPAFCRALTAALWLTPGLPPFALATSSLAAQDTTLHSLRPFCAALQDKAPLATSLCSITQNMPCSRV